MNEHDGNTNLARVYELAQQSAEHHDVLLWEVTAIIWSASTLMLGFAFDSKDGLRVLLGAVIGIVLTVFAHINYCITRHVRNTKYAICRKIEQELHFRHKPHSLVDRKYRKGIQTKFHLCLTLLFVVVWFVIAVQAYQRI